MSYATCTQLGLLKVAPRAGSFDTYFTGLGNDNAYYSFRGLAEDDKGMVWQLLHRWGEDRPGKKDGIPECVSGKYAVRLVCGRRPALVNFFNKIIADYDTDPEKIIYQNLNGYAENAGFSLNSDWNFTNGLKAMAGFTLMDVSVVENGRREWQIQTPHFTANWSLSYPIARCNLTLDYNGHLTSPMRLPVFANDYRPEQSPWFSIHNIQVTWKPRRKSGGDLKSPPDFEVYAGVKNLFNFYPREDVIMRAHDPFDKLADDPVDNPNGYTFDPSYNYAPVQGLRGFVGVRVVLK